MPHTHRFYCPGLDAAAAGGELSLPDAEARHAVSVLRLRAGDPVELFDGCGLAGAGVFLRGSRTEAVVALERLTRREAPAVAVFLAPAWPHRDKVVDEIVCRGTELGVAGFHFWRADRSQRAPGALERWHRHTVESCKQCGRNMLPSLHAWDSLDDLLAEETGAVVAADLDGGADGAVLLPPDAARVLLLAGPEGDFTERERGLITAKESLRVSLGPQVLRTEAAAAVLATLALNAAGLLGARLVLP